MNTTASRSSIHSDFAIERVLAAPIERVWSALSEKEAKRAWFGVEEGNLAGTAFEVDFRVGGHDVNEVRFGEGPSHRFFSTYTDIVEYERIVYTYDMWLDDHHISTSVTTVTLEQQDGGTLMTFTEQGVHLDGHDTGEQREHGTRELLDALAKTVEG